MHAELRHRESWTITIAIWLAFVATFAAVVVVSETRLAREIEQWVDEARGKDGSGPDAVAEKIARQIIANPTLQRRELAAEAVYAQPPDVLLALYQRLSKTPETAPLAVAVLGMAAKRYQHVELMIQAAREYSVGRLVEKDYVEAIRLYSNPLIFRLPGVKYYLAEILLADDNPNRDMNRGLSLLYEAGSQGHAKAAERLKELGKTPPQ